jgi:GNAT superfamily N-acetyltransferase
MSHWAAYTNETWGAETLEDELGFISFQEFPNHIYVQDCYIVPEYRRTGEATRFMQKIEELAFSLGKAEITTRLDITQKTAVLSLKAQLAYGFVPFRADNGIILLSKKVEAQHG